MLKPPIILPIVPSKLWQLTQCLLLIGIAALSYWVGGNPAGATVIVLGGAYAWRIYQGQSKRVLSLTSTGSLFHGRWLSSVQRPAEPAWPMNTPLSEAYEVRCDYLGPWLIGLYVGKQRVWLWPDSAPSAHLREVRKLFHRPGQ
jgi:toxin CptA